MAAQRPAFSRVDTDVALTDIDHKSKPSSANGSGLDHEPQLANDKDKVHDHAVHEVGDISYDVTAEHDHFGEAIVVQDAEELVTHVLHVDDDPTLNPWTFRAFFLGLLFRLVNVVEIS